MEGHSKDIYIRDIYIRKRFYLMFSFREKEQSRQNVELNCRLVVYNILIGPIPAFFR